MGGGQVKNGEPNKPKHQKRTQEITGTFDKDKCMIETYDHGVLTVVGRVGQRGEGSREQESP